MPLSRSAPSRALAALVRRVPLLLAIALATPASAVVRYVSPCGNDGWVGVQAACAAPLGPKRTVQAAIDASSDGDEVVVLPGVYVGGIDLDGKAIHLRGAGGPDVTILDGGGVETVVTCSSLEGPGTIIEGFTIRNGRAPAALGAGGGGILVALASPRFIDCLITGNVASQRGGGALVSVGAPVFEACTFRLNDAELGLGGGICIRAGGSVTMLACIVQDNDATSAGGGILVEGGGALTMIGGSIRDNQSELGGGGLASFSSDVTLDGVLVRDNGTPNVGGGIRADGGTMTLVDTTVRFNQGGAGGGLSANNASLSILRGQVSDNSVFPGAAFVRGGGLALSLGTAVLEDVLVARNDAGASSGGGLDVEGGTCTIIGGSFVDGVARLGGGIAGREGAVVSVTDTIFSGNLVFAGSLGGGLGGGVCVDSGAQLHVTGATFTGNEAQSGGGIAVYGSATLDLHGSVLEDNFALLGGGGVSASQGTPETIRIATTTFQENIALTRGGGVKLDETGASLEFVTMTGNRAARGGGISAFADDQPRLVQVRDCLLQQNLADGFFLAGPEGGGSDDGEGGGVALVGLVEAAIVRTSLLGNDAVREGGGLWLDTQARAALVRCRLQGNEAGFGGGLFLGLECEARVVDSLLSQNATTVGEGGAAAVSGVGQLRLSSSTLTLNVAAGGSGHAVDLGTAGSSLVIENSIVHANGGANQVAGPGSVLARYSIVPASISGPGCLDADPQFIDVAAGDFGLAAGSPAVDAGLPWLLPPDLADADDDGDTFERLDVDLDGAPRSRVGNGAAAACGGVAITDMGALERIGEPGSAPGPFGDVDGDGLIGFSDVLVVLAAWGDAPDCPLPDLNADGVVDFADLLLVLAEWS